jgi:hypothetical protein
VAAHRGFGTRRADCEVTGRSRSPLSGGNRVACRAEKLSFYLPWSTPFFVLVDPPPFLCGGQSPCECWTCWGLCLDTTALQRGIPGTRWSLSTVDYVPALCTRQASGPVKAGAARQQHSRSGAIRSRFRKCRAGEGKTRRGSMEKPTARRADPGNRGKTGKATFLRVAVEVRPIGS